MAASRSGQSVTPTLKGIPGSPPRTSFAKIREPLEVPNLLALQTESFDWLVGNAAWQERMKAAGDTESRSGLAEILGEISEDQTPPMMAKHMSKTSSPFVICINNEGYLASLEKRKIYVTIRDPVAEKHGQLRIVDESGEDYLYPKALFRSIALPQAVRRAVLAV